MWLTNDVAVLKLEKSSSHKPARLGDADGSDDKPKTKATVLGWGEVNQKDLPDTLQAVDVEIIPDDQCAEYTIDTDVTLCAGTERGKGFCGSDMGGPLIANNVVVGIANALPGAAADCGELPGLYTRVSYVVDCITDILNGGSSGKSEVLLFPATR
ncbi:Trypsin [Phytophthora infestans]|uniref:Trypsin n=1 Tax=Phytophthora infestans TaxID=4787 RepID=A0A833T6H6_PHYIN|nr:Trypsin [Phytophthora infestans]KAF4136292.1 Trypsin [Phytophthora infestans]